MSSPLTLPLVNGKTPEVVNEAGTALVSCSLLPLVWRLWLLNGLWL